jgi:hypothetical protein
MALTNQVKTGEQISQLTNESSNELTTDQTSSETNC